MNPPRPRRSTSGRSLCRLLLLPLWLGVPVASIGPSAAAPEAGGQREALAAMRERIHNLGQEIDAKSGERDALTHALRDAERDIGALSRRVRDLDRDLARHQRRLTDLDQGLQQQRRALQQQREALAAQVRAAYAMGRQERIKILLNQQDPGVVSRAMVYHDYLQRARVGKMARIRRDVERLAASEAEIRAEEARLVRLQAQQSKELAGLQRAQRERRDLVARLTREIGDQGRQLERLRDDEKRLQVLLQGIESALDDIPLSDPQPARFAGLRGRLPWPASGQLVTRFGAPKLGSLVWDGVMISAPEGDEVRAIHNGRVAFADWLRGFGLLTIVDHGDGYMTLYGHNQSLFKEVGDWVDAGETIALVGTSGGRERSAVYFGIRHQGRAVDPSRWCQRPAGGRVS